MISNRITWKSLVDLSSCRRWLDTDSARADQLGAVGWSATTLALSASKPSRGSARHTYILLTPWPISVCSASQTPKCKFDSKAWTIYSKRNVAKTRHWFKTPQKNSFAGWVAWILQQPSISREGTPWKKGHFQNLRDDWLISERRVGLATEFADDARQQKGKHHSED